MLNDTYTQHIIPVRTLIWMKNGTIVPNAISHFSSHKKMVNDQVDQTNTSKHVECDVLECSLKGNRFPVKMPFNLWVFAIC